jgi:hypothetical protein
MPNTKQLIDVAAIFGETGYSVKVRNGDKTADDKHIVRYFAVDVEAWNAEFLAWVFDAGIRRLIGEKLNGFECEGGAKLAKARDVFAQADQGLMPSIFTAADKVKRRSGVTLNELDIAVVNAGIVYLTEKLHAKAAKKGLKGTGKKGNYIGADLRRIAGEGPAGELFTDKGDFHPLRVIAFMFNKVPTVYDAVCDSFKPLALEIEL